MPHPNEDFIKKFLGNSSVDSQKQKELQRKARLEQYYNSLNQSKIVPLDKSKKEITDSALSKIFLKVNKTEDKYAFNKMNKEIEKSEKQKQIAESKKILKKQRLEEYYSNQNSRQTALLISETISELNSMGTKPSARSNKNEWIEKRTPFGIFYYNPVQNLWMNSFGVKHTSFDEFFKLESFDYETTSGGAESSAQLIKESYFSDDATKLAYYDSSANNVTVYSAAYTTSPLDVTLTQLNILSLGSTTFSSETYRKLFISNDGTYAIVSCPSNKSVYLFNVTSNTLLQTITEDQPNFGSVISVDQNFYGMAISSTELYKSSSTYDTRVSSIDASTRVYYYERNYDSAATPKFKLVHSNNAYALMRKKGLERLNDLSLAGTVHSSIDNYVDTGVYGVSDLACKGYNFAQASIANKQNQITYRTSSYNYDSPRYLSLTKYPALSSLTPQTVQTKIVYGAGPSLSPALPTDAESGLTFQMLSLPSVKQFSIVRQSGATYYKDKSYYLPTAPAPVVGFKSSSYNLSYSDGVTYFNQNIVGTYAEKTFIRGNLDLTSSSSSSTYLTPVIEEETLLTKIAINDTDTYHVSQVLTKSSIKNIRIYRSPNTTTEGLNTFHYEDFTLANKNAGATANPSYLTAGLIKIIYQGVDLTALEDTFFTRASMTSDQQTQLGCVASKPYLANPANCPLADFAYRNDVDGIVNGTLQKVYTSPSFLFLCFDTKTLVFFIRTPISYKPLIFQTILNTALGSYNFSYDSSGSSWFTRGNKIYRFNSSTNSLDLAKTIT
jgi:hypothetical protein